MVVIVKRNTARRKLRSLLNRSRAKKNSGFDAKRFNGALPLKGDPVKLQRKMRDEWA
ncbi:MAG: hypothetical protein JNM49_09530 [Flavobacteriales bacterium]|jgi:hypothetical protein|nr:hypothetical protein [Flavobacteriales bacterium]